MISLTRLLIAAKHHSFICSDYSYHQFLVTPLSVKDIFTCCFMMPDVCH